MTFSTPLFRSTPLSSASSRQMRQQESGGRAVPEHDCQEVQDQQAHGDQGRAGTGKPGLDTPHRPEDQRRVRQHDLLPRRPPETAETVRGDDGASAPPGAVGGGKASLPGSKAVLPPGKNEDEGVVNTVDHLVKPVDPNNTQITIPIEKEKDQEDAAASASGPEPGQGRPAKVPESAAGGRSDAGLALRQTTGSHHEGSEKRWRSPNQLPG